MDFFFFENLIIDWSDVVKEQKNDMNMLKKKYFVFRHIH